MSSLLQLNLKSIILTNKKKSYAQNIQKVVKAGKVAEVGWSVGDTKTLEINGQEKEATIIGLDHDGENTATFMVMSDVGMAFDSFGHVMNSNETNAGGWEASEMRAWLNSDVYNSMSNKEQIKEVTKMTDNVGYSETNEARVVTVTYDKVFLLSPIETGCQIWDSYPYKDVFNAEGNVYDWFNPAPDGCGFWLRSPGSSDESIFFLYMFGQAGGNPATYDRNVFPTFVIG